jgi:DNA-binding transcriptional ArsR family regulator
MANRPEPDLAGVAELVGDRARGAMLTALLGGEWLPAGELAARAGVARSTASGHLARLVEHGLVTRRVSGRHRYFALAGPDVAAALEALARLVPAVQPEPGRAASPEVTALRFARTCYDHLAGALGVLLADTLVERGLVAPDRGEVTGRGGEWLHGLGIDVDALRRGRRTLVRPCLDWSERRDHVAGAIGAAITGMLLDRRWIVRMDGTRAVRLTARGQDGLHQALGLEVA